MFSNWGLVFTAVAFVGIGCGGASTEKTDALCGNGSRTGVTACSYQPTNGCAAGQYCDDNALQCSPGCTSDTNCAAGDYCARASGAAVGSCQACAAQTNDRLIARCQAAVKQLDACAAIKASDAATLAAACASTLNDTMRTQLATCVEFAGADCVKVKSCAPMQSGSGNAAHCAQDTDCSSRIGIDHEICQGGLCQVGCRANDDCGTGYSCDTSNVTYPVCVPW
jgi:hypothetical protein